MLTNFGSTHEQDLYRVNTLRRMGYDPYVMIYDRPSAPPITRQLQRWVNNKGAAVSETILCGDALKQLQSLESESVHVCVTSLPYYRLRDYEAVGQIGLEETPEKYIESLVRVFREVRRVLRTDGTLWLNIGDTYQRKELLGIPWALAFALRSDGWILRQDIIWHKSKCLPESVRDRCTRCHEYVFLLSKSEHYYFDSMSIREPTAESTKARLAQNISKQAGSTRQPGRTNGPIRAAGNSQFRNKRDVWTLSTGNFHGAHFAVFPEKLVEPCILAGSPEGGTVLDPFTGSGTAGVVAKRLKRNFVGIEINPAYCKLAADRIALTE